MPAITNWGPSTWNLFHTLAENINETHEKTIIPKLFFYISSICLYLPCPDCKHHATAFMSKVPPVSISIKSDFKRMLLVFHNSVNRRKMQKQFTFEQLDKYKGRAVFAAFKAFVFFFNTKGNMREYADTIQREKLVKDFERFLIANRGAFCNF
jgi:hypothetical protein